MADEIRILVADSKPEGRSQIRDMLSKNHKMIIIGECGDGETAVKLTVDLKPDIVIIDENIPSINGVSVTEIITAKKPDTFVIFMSFSKGKEHVKNAMAAGVREYLIKPFNSSKLIYTILSLYERSIKRVKIFEEKGLDILELKPKVITVFSPKGGSGKTTLSANLAISLARKTKKNVVLLDFDFQFGDIAILLNMFPKKTLLDLVTNISSIDENMLEEYLTYSSNGIKILPAPIAPEYADFINAQSIEKIIRTLMINYDYIVIDTASGFNEINLEIMDLSDILLILTAQDLLSIKDVKASLEALKKIKYDENKISVILNRYNRNIGISKTEIERTIGKSVIHLIPDEYLTVVKSINEGMPFVTKTKSRLSKSVEQIVNTIVEQKEEHPRGLFGRRKRA